MDSERQYLAALELTQQMREAANTQDWEALTALEHQQAAMVAAISPVISGSPSLAPACAIRIAGIIRQIEQENAEITEHVQVWQKHARILLREPDPQSGPGHPPE